MKQNKILINGTLIYSFGKNGTGISDEFEQLNDIIEPLSKDNYVYLTDSSIDGLDDVYSLKFNIIPRNENEQYFNIFETKKNA